MAFETLILKPIVNSPVILIILQDGTTVGLLTFLCEATHPWMLDFIPTGELFFCQNFPEAQYYLENTWILFNANKVI